MTSEGASQTEPWIEEHEAEYAYCYDGGGKFSRALGVTGLPTAVLIDPSGIIQWVGHPGNLQESTIEEHIGGAVSKPLWEWPKDGKKVKKAVLAGALGKAMAEAEKLGEEHADIKAVVRGLIDGKLGALQAAQKAGDWMRVDDSGSDLKKAFAGLPELDTVKMILSDLKADKEAQAILGGQRKVAKLLAKDFKRKDIPKLEKKLQAIAKSHPNSAADRDAKAGLKRLQGMKKKD